MNITAAAKNSRRYYLSFIFIARWAVKIIRIWYSDHICSLTVIFFTVRWFTIEPVGSHLVIQNMRTVIRLNTHNYITGTCITVRHRRSIYVTECFQIPLVFPIIYVCNIINKYSAFVGFTDKVIIRIYTFTCIIIFNRSTVFIYPLHYILVGNSSCTRKIILCLCDHLEIINNTFFIFRSIRYFKFVHHIVVLIPHNGIYLFTVIILKLNAGNIDNRCFPFKVRIDKRQTSSTFAFFVSYIFRCPGRCSYFSVLIIILRTRKIHHNWSSCIFRNCNAVAVIKLNRKGRRSRIISERIRSRKMIMR